MFQSTIRIFSTYLNITVVADQKLLVQVSNDFKFDDTINHDSETDYKTVLISLGSSMLFAIFSTSLQYGQKSQMLDKKFLKLNCNLVR